jgi:hypothetical protein
MKLKVRKLTLFSFLLTLASIFVIAINRGPILASGDNNGITSTILDDLSFTGRFTLSPEDVNNYHFSGEKMIVKAYRIDKGREIHGEVLLSESTNGDLSGSARLMISHISKTYPFISRERFETGGGDNRISYREWGTANSDTEATHYQNLIVAENNFTWYIILLYKDEYRNEVDKIIGSVNFTI